MTNTDSWPLIHVMAIKTHTKEKEPFTIFRGKHPAIPRVGEYFHFQYWTLKICRVEYYNLTYHPEDVQIADIYVENPEGYWK